MFGKPALSALALIFRQPALRLIFLALLLLGAHNASIYPYQSLIAIERIGLSEPGFALVLVLAKDSTGNGDNVLLGDLFIIINAISYTIYFILVKPLMVKYNAVVVLRWVFTIGLVLVLPFGWTEFTEIPWERYTTIDFTSMGLIVITGTFLAYLFNLYGIKVLGPSVAGFYIYTQPVFAALIAIFFLHEQLALYKILAAILIFSGVYLANKQFKK